jgi:hypothetical protein
MSIAQLEMDDAGHIVGRLPALGSGFVYLRLMPTTRLSRKGQPIWTGIIGTGAWRAGVTAYQRDHPEYGRSLTIFSDGEGGETHMLNINQSRDDLGSFYVTSRQLEARDNAGQTADQGGQSGTALDDMNDPVPF